MRLYMIVWNNTKVINQHLEITAENDYWIIIYCIRTTTKKACDVPFILKSILSDIFLLTMLCISTEMIKLY